jgi:hydroxyacylglutathione hydrolase
MLIQVVPLPAFQDNYIWCLRNGSDALVVDPGDAAPVRAYLAQEGLRLRAILVTHHHADHVGGVETLATQYSVPVFGPASEPIPGRTQALREGDKARVDSLDIEFDVLDVPGHTAGHIAYSAPGILFCGDTLFSAGCGRLFEGTPQQMMASLGKFAALPGSTRVYCTHEYTAANIRFARTVDPDNVQLAERERAVSAVRQAGQPSLPSTIATELETNPFLRVDRPEIVAAAARYADRPLAAPVDAFAVLREWKNRF